MSLGSMRPRPFTSTQTGGEAGKTAKTDAMVALCTLYNLVVGVSFKKAVDRDPTFHSREA